ncbi:MAG: hypothetical protein ACYTGL_00400 [Planctomycetota bacterium]
MRACNVVRVAFLAHRLLFPLSGSNKLRDSGGVDTHTNHRNDEVTADRGKVREPSVTGCEDRSGNGRDFGVPGPPGTAAREYKRPGMARRRTVAIIQVQHEARW